MMVISMHTAYHASGPGYSREASLKRLALSLSKTHHLRVLPRLPWAMGSELRLNVWTQRHWQRTSAVQCCHQQRLIDKVIPIYFKVGVEGKKSRMSQVFISDKVRESKSSHDALHGIVKRRDDSILTSKDSLEDCDLPPYITILVDLGQPTSFSVTFPERYIDDRCLRIYAGGVDEITYPFLAQHETVKKVLQNLVRRQRMPETETPYTQYLDAQVKFGSTATAHHMEWEPHGSSVPVITTAGDQESES